jgi:nickel-dependent lactate racemase
MDGNPVHEDMVEGARLTGRDLFLYNTILGRNKRVQSVYAGHWIEAHRAGASDYLAGHSVALDSLRPLVIASCGGFPRDINMIQAHKTLEFAQYATESGGTIILLAECREGTGHSSFFHWFEHANLDEFERRLRADYEVYGQTAYSLLSKARRFRVICVSALDPGIVRAMGMEPARDLEEARSLVDSETARSPGYILPRGSEVLPSLG